MSVFNNDSFRDSTFDLLSGIANDPTKFDDLTRAFLDKLHQRDDADDLRRFTREIYQKILALQPVQLNPAVQLKDVFHEKIVVIYMWAYSNIQSLQMTPKLTMLHKRYSSAGVNVIGIHSPKYEHGKNKANVRHAIDEQSIPFNVVNDHSLQVWKHLDCQVWPTVLIFGPDALPLYIFEGDNHVQHVERFVIPVINYYKSSVRATSSSTTVNSPEDFHSTTKNEKPAKFAYPSHVCVTNNGQVCISFSGSNQLIHCEIDGKVIDIVGNGQAGLADGEIQQVEFDAPHGLVEFNNCIYIADTNNHAIRVFDPSSRRVLTLIGTGRLGNDRVGGLKRSQQPIASPWDVCITESPFDHKSVLLISMTGQHQIWAYAFEDTCWWNDLVIEKNSCLAILGNGDYENRNGNEPMNTAFAAPRGICNGIMNGEPVLFIADSESSSIRVVTLKDGNVSHLIGGDPDPKNLSAFGDLDGSGYHAKLQYPVGVAFHYPSSRLFLTDTFNNKLKYIDMNTLVCSSYSLTDVDTKKQRGETNFSKFNEPCGLAIFDHFMFVADKNNSHVKRIDLNHSTVVRCRFDLSDTLNEERSFGSKQAYLLLELPERLHIRESTASTWTIEDEEGFKICDGELLRHTSEPMLLDYIPRDKQVGRLKYALMVYEDDVCTVFNGETQPNNQTDSTIEFTIKID